MRNNCCKHIYLVVISLVLLVTSGYSQQNNNWVFGFHAGLDFNQSPALPVYTGIVDGSPSAAVSDDNGQLLFYTNGDKVWNQDHVLMANGGQLITDPLLPPTPGGCYLSINGATVGFHGNGWTALGATVITPVPGSRYRYYIFSLIPQWLSPYGGRLYYAIVDMELNGGLGDVEQKSVLLDSNLVAFPEVGASYVGAPLEAIHGEHCDLWLLALKQSSQQGTFLRAYNITDQGIAAPVVSLLSIGGGSTFCVSPDRRHIAFTHKAMLYDFDPATGIIPGPGLSLNPDSIMNYYRFVAFSSDGSKLYYGSKLLSGPDCHIFQYNLDIADIPGSRFSLGNGYSNNMRLGPNGKIYIQASSFWDPALYGTIESPNEAGLDCNLALNTPVYPANACLYGYELPRFVPAIPYDTITFVVQVATPACMPVALKPVDTTGRDYLWSDGSTGDSLVASEVGWYFVEYFSAPCTYHVDSFEVKLLEVPVPALGPDTTYCYGDPIHLALYAPTAEGLELTWSDGSYLPVLTVTDSGSYWLEVGLGDCRESDTIRLSRMQCDCYVGMPNAFTPNGDGINDRLLPVINPDCPGAGGYYFHVFNRFGQRVYSSAKAGEGWDGRHLGVSADGGTYFFELGFHNALTGLQHYRKGDVILIR